MLLLLRSVHAAFILFCPGYDSRHWVGALLDWGAFNLCDDLGKTAEQGLRHKAIIFTAAAAEGAGPCFGR
jgi:hypothetical protein